MPIICPDCGAQQPDGTAFCDMCGANLQTLQGTGQPLPEESLNAPVSVGVPDFTPPPLPPSPVLTSSPSGEVTCPNCGAQLTPGSKFCDMCGALVGEPILPVMPPVPQPQPPFPVQPAVMPQPQPPLPSAVPVIPQSIPVPLPVPPPSAVQPYALPIQGRLIVPGTNVVLPFPTGKADFIVGREDPASGQFPDIDLSSHGGDQGGVSRRHARIFLQGTQYYIEDLNSTNYTFVNQQRLPPHQSRPLRNGDELRLGRVKLIVSL